MYEIFASAFDVSHCFSFSPEVLITSFPVSVYAKSQLVREDGSLVIGLDKSDVLRELYDDNGAFEASSVLLKLTGEGRLELTDYDGVVYRGTMSLSSMLSKTEMDSACVTNIETQTIDDCSSYNLVRVNFPGVLTSTALTKVFLNSVRYQDGAPYYFGGSADFQFNNWTGEMTFNSFDPYSAPTWEATSSLGEYESGYFYF